MSLNINIAIVSTVKTLAKDLQSIRETLADFPEFSATVTAAPSVARAASVSANPMRSPEENKLRDDYRAEHPLGKGFRMTHFLTHKYKGNALAALRGWKAGEWTLTQAGEEPPPPQAGEAGEVDGDEY